VSGMEARTHLLTVSGGLRVTTRAGHLACVLVQEHTSLQEHVPSGAARDVAARGHWKPDWVRENVPKILLLTSCRQTYVPPGSSLAA
jgi:hypothetical protein